MGYCCSGCPSSGGAKRLRRVAGLPSDAGKRAPDSETFGWIVVNFNRNIPETVFVSAGEEPPRVSVDGATLAQAAWNAIELLTPTVETNPKVGDRGTTLVGMDTWVWATASIPRTVTATATAGPTTATASPSG